MSHPPASFPFVNSELFGQVQKYAGRLELVGMKTDTPHASTIGPRAGHCWERISTGRKTCKSNYYSAEEIKLNFLKTPIGASGKH